VCLISLSSCRACGCYLYFSPKAATLAHRRALLDGCGLAHHPLPARVDERRRLARSAANALAKHYAAQARAQAGEQSGQAEQHRSGAPLVSAECAREVEGEGSGKGSRSTSSTSSTSSTNSDRSGGGRGADGEAAAVPEARKAKGARGIPARRLAELLEVVRVFVGRASVAEVTPGDVAACQALSVTFARAGAGGEACRDASAENGAPDNAEPAAAEQSGNDGGRSAAAKKKRKRPPAGAGAALKPGEAKLAVEVGALGSGDGDDDGENDGGCESKGSSADVGPEEAFMLQRRLAAACFFVEAAASAAAPESGGGGRVAGMRAEVQAFVEAWRRLFVASVRPRFLPEGWRADRLVWSE